MGIVDHKLTPDLAKFQQSPNCGPRFDATLPDTLVIHYTAGASLDSSVKTLCDPESKASAHLVVGRDGSVVQLVPFDGVAWHAGASRWGNRTGLNKYSLGIEIDNAGRLRRTQSGDFVTWFGTKIPAPDVISAVHRNEQEEAFWETYTPEQVARVFELAQLLVSQYRITTIVGHEEIAPGRKSDPGPAFPLDKLRERILLRGRDLDGAPEEEAHFTSGTVTASLLNVRAGPSLLSPLATAPLKFGARVEIAQVESQGVWLRMHSPTLGWVQKDYITFLVDTAAGGGGARAGDGGQRSADSAGGGGSAEAGGKVENVDAAAKLAETAWLNQAW